MRNVVLLYNAVLRTSKKMFLIGSLAWCLTRSCAIPVSVLDVVLPHRLFCVQQFGGWLFFLYVSQMFRKDTDTSFCNRQTLEKPRIFCRYSILAQCLPSNRPCDLSSKEMGWELSWESPGWGCGIDRKPPRLFCGFLVEVAFFGVWWGP